MRHAAAGSPRTGRGCSSPTAPGTARSTSSTCAAGTPARVAVGEAVCGTPGPVHRQGGSCTATSAPTATTSAASCGRRGRASSSASTGGPACTSSAEDDPRAPPAGPVGGRRRARRAQPATLDRARDPRLPAAVHVRPAAHAPAPPQRCGHRGRHHRVRPHRHRRCPPRPAQFCVGGNCVINEGCRFETGGADHDGRPGVRRPRRHRADHDPRDRSPRAAVPRPRPPAGHDR